MKKLRILIADDHGMVRHGLRAVIEDRQDWDFCGEAADGRQAYELAKKLRPDIVVLDLTMPELNGLETTRKIRAALPQTQVLILTMHDSESLAQQVLEAGARGYVLKNDAPELFPKAVDALAAGRMFFTPKVANLVLETLTRGASANGAGERSPSKSRLTPRERELVQLLAEGKSNKEAADALGISLNTVETHRKNVMSKLRLRSTSDLVRYAVRNNIIQP